MLDDIRKSIEKLGIPGRDLYELPSSKLRFPDDAHYRMEISGIERLSILEATIDEMDKRKIPVHRIISTVMRSTLLDEKELIKFAELAKDAKLEVIITPGPRSGWDTGRQLATPEGVISGARIRGSDNLSYVLADIKRCTDLGFRGFFVMGEGLLWLLNELRKIGEIPKDVIFKVSIYAGHANQAGARVVETLSTTDPSYNSFATISFEALKKSYGGIIIATVVMPGEYSSKVEEIPLPMVNMNDNTVIPKPYYYLVYDTFIFSTYSFNYTLTASTHNISIQIEKINRLEIGYIFYGNHTNPWDQDCDEDKLLDGEEVGVYGRYFTDPFSPDTDADRLTDYEEVNVWDTNPKRNDSDEDTLGDFIDPNPLGENNPPQVINLTTPPLPEGEGKYSWSQGCEFVVVEESEYTVKVVGYCSDHKVIHKSPPEIVESTPKGDKWRVFFGKYVTTEIIGSPHTGYDSVTVRYPITSFVINVTDEHGNYVEYKFKLDENYVKITNIIGVVGLGGVTAYGYPEGSPFVCTFSLEALAISGACLLTGLTALAALQAVLYMATAEGTIETLGEFSFPVDIVIWGFTWENIDYYLTEGFVAEKIYEAVEYVRGFGYEYIKKVTGDGEDEQIKKLKDAMDYMNDVEVWEDTNDDVVDVWRIHILWPPKGPHVRGLVVYLSEDHKVLYYKLQWASGPRGIYTSLVGEGNPYETKIYAPPG